MYTAHKPKLKTLENELLNILETIMYRLEHPRFKDKPLGEYWVKYIKFHVEQAYERQKETN